MRCFEDGDVTHVEGRIDPLADIETIETELMLADLESLEKRVVAPGEEGQGRRQGRQGDCSISMQPLPRLLREGKPARLVEVKPEEREALRMLGLLTSKPVLYVCNVEEGAADKGNALSPKVVARAAEGRRGLPSSFSAKIESEIAVLPAAEQKDYLEAVGLRSRASTASSAPATGCCDLITYFTVGPKEARAWTINSGTRRRRPPASSIPISKRALSAPRRSPTTIMYAVEAARRARAKPASCGWKARTMSSPMAT